MANSKYDYVSEDFIRNKFKNTQVIDKGEVIVETEEDQRLVERYMEALRDGNEFYKPAGLKFKPK